MRSRWRTADTGIARYRALRDLPAGALIARRKSLMSQQRSAGSATSQDSKPLKPVLLRGVTATQTATVTGWVCDFARCLPVGIEFGIALRSCVALAGRSRGRRSRVVGVFAAVPGQAHRA